MVIVRKAVDIAIQKAKTSGMSVVGVTNYASATGALGIWARDIARNGLIGLVFSQVSQQCLRRHL
jgi:LDH2 family malate/lactate/ureidoglycolate dehydrogenase